MSRAVGESSNVHIIFSCPIRQTLTPAIELKDAIVSRVPILLPASPPGNIPAIVGPLWIAWVFTTLHHLGPSIIFRCLTFAVRWTEANVLSHLNPFETSANTPRSCRLISSLIFFCACA